MPNLHVTLLCTAKNVHSGSIGSQAHQEGPHPCLVQSTSPLSSALAHSTTAQTGHAALTGACCSADSSRRAFYKEFMKVVDAADVVIEVLDARDPLSCRCLDVERLVRRSGADKKVILLLNKIGKHKHMLLVATLRLCAPLVHVSMVPCCICAALSCQSSWRFKTSQSVCSTPSLPCSGSKCS